MQPPPPPADLLTQIQRTVSLSAKQAEQIQQAFSPASVAKGAHLLAAGEVCQVKSYVVQGCLRTYSIDEAGRETILMFSMEDWWAYEHRSFYFHTPALFAIQALEDTQLLQIRLPDLEALLAAVPPLERWLRMLYLRGLAAHELRTDQGLRLDAEARYQLLLQRYPGITQRVPQKHLAAYLGITPAFLSMLRNRWAAAGRSSTS